MIGIAVINYKCYEKTIKCIESIQKTIQTPYKIYLLENGSENESANILKEKYCNDDRIELLISNQNHGYARGNNICIKRMRQDGCKYGIISNNDIVCVENTINKLIKDLKDYKDFVIVGPMIVDPEGNYQQSVKLKKYKPVEYMIKSTYLSRFFKKLIDREKELTKDISDFIEVSWTSGAFFAFSLEKMRMIGDFDPATFLFYEEYILSAKARRCNLKIGYDPTVKVMHYHAVSTGGGLNITSKMEADRSERYYFQTYEKTKKLYLGLLKIIRLMEVLFTFGKRKQFREIKQYFAEIDIPLR